MNKQVVIVLTVILALAVVSGFAFYNSNSGSETINWQIAGSIFSNIQVTTNPQTGETTNFSILNLDAKGAPGTARIEVVGTAAPVAPNSLCPEDVNLQLRFMDGGFVATFPDQSLLFFKVDQDSDQNALCVFFDPTKPNNGIFDYDITGGWGRFEGATGHATVSVISWGVSTSLSAEAGEIVGTIELP